MVIDAFVVMNYDVSEPVHRLRELGHMSLEVAVEAREQFHSAFWQGL